MRFIFGTLALLVALLVFSFVTTSCDRRAELTPEERAKAQAYLDNLDARAATRLSNAGISGEAFSVPSDPNVTYYMIENVETATGIRRVVTGRVSRKVRAIESGDTHSVSIRRIDCTRATFDYLGTGDTLDEALAREKASGPPDMGGLFDGSISSYIAGAACNGL